MNVPWRLGKKPHYAEQEKRTGKKKGARQQMNSGRVWSGLRDVKRSIGEINLLYDNKEATKSGRFTLTEKEWNSLVRDAKRTPPGHHPVIQLDFVGHRLVIIPELLFDTLLDDADKH